MVVSLSTYSIRLVQLFSFFSASPIFAFSPRHRVAATRLSGATEKNLKVGILLPDEKLCDGN